MSEMERGQVKSRAQEFKPELGTVGFLCTREVMVNRHDQGQGKGEAKERHQVMGNPFCCLAALANQAK